MTLRSALIRLKRGARNSIPWLRAASNEQRYGILHSPPPPNLRLASRAARTVCLSWPTRISQDPDLTDAVPPHGITTTTTSTMPTVKGETSLLATLMLVHVLLHPRTFRLRLPNATPYRYECGRNGPALATQSLESPKNKAGGLNQNWISPAFRLAYLSIVVFA